MPGLGTVNLPTPSLSAVRVVPDNLLQWTVSNSKIGSFKVERKIGAGAWSTVSTPSAIAGVRSYQYLDEDSAADGTYNYRVSSVRGGREAVSTERQIIVGGGSPPSDLLTAADFSYAGAFKMPQGGTGFAANFTVCPITFREHGGVDRLISVGYNAGTFPIYEVNIPALSMSSNPGDYNTATIYKVWGAAYDALIPPIVNGNRKYGVFWDDVDQRLYQSTGPFYNFENVWPTIGYSTLNDDTSVETPVGIWALEGVNHKAAKSGVCRIPNTAFITANCPGKPLAVGFGSGGSSTFEGHSIGPSLFAITPPDINTQPNESEIPNVELLNYPYVSGQTPSVPLRARRDDGYSSKFWGTGASYTSDTITLPSTETIVPDYPGMVGLVVSIAAGTGSGQSRTVTEISGLELTLDSPWSVTPDSSSEWEIPSDWTWSPSGGVGYWTPGDAVYQGTVWIKNATKEAIAVFVTFATGRQSYMHNPNGPNYEGCRHEIWLYDPAELERVAQSEIENYEAEPYEKIAFEMPFLDYPLGLNEIGTEGGDTGKKVFGGVTLNADHSRLYFSCPGAIAVPFVGHFPVIGAIDIAG